MTLPEEQETKFGGLMLNMEFARVEMGLKFLNALIVKRLMPFLEGKEND